MESCCICSVLHWISLSELAFIDHSTELECFTYISFLTIFPLKHMLKKEQIGISLRSCSGKIRKPNTFYFLRTKIFKLIFVFWNALLWNVLLFCFGFCAVPVRYICYTGMFLFLCFFIENARTPRCKRWLKIYESMRRINDTQHTQHARIGPTSE